MWQNPALAIGTKWLPVRKLQFPIPRSNRQADVELLAKLFEAGEYHAVDGPHLPAGGSGGGNEVVRSEQRPATSS